MVTLLQAEAAGESIFDPLKAFFHPAGSRLQVFWGQGLAFLKITCLYTVDVCIYIAFITATMCQNL